MAVSSSSGDRARHWDEAYQARGVDGVSWHQPVPRVSLELIDALGISRSTAVVDVGGGASTLVDHLVARGFEDLTVVDVSARALEATRDRLGPDSRVTFLREDLLEWRPARRYELWHDRAVFHFLVREGDRRRYLQALRGALAARAAVVIGTFAPDAPEMCSGLPVVRYSADELVSLLGDRFEPLESRREEHVTPRGRVQPFTWLAGRLDGSGVAEEGSPA